MVLPGYALMAQGPNAPERFARKHHILAHSMSQAFAIQGACYVVAAGAVRTASSIPERYRALELVDHPGLSCIIDPFVEIIAGPVEGETILTATASREVIRRSKMSRDMGGHYSRPDIFQLHVNRAPLKRIIEHGMEMTGAAMAGIGNNIPTSRSDGQTSEGTLLRDDVSETC